MPSLPSLPCFEEQRPSAAGAAAVVVLERRAEVLAHRRVEQEAHALVDLPEVLVEQARERVDRLHRVLLQRAELGRRAGALLILLLLLLHAPPLTLR